MTNYSRSVLKSNGLHRPKIRLKKFGFSPKTIPANIAKKLPSQLPTQRVFQLLSQTAHVCFHRRKRVHTRLSEKDRTQGHTRRNRGCFGWGRYHYPQTVLRGSETLRSRDLKRQTLPLLGLGRGCSRRSQKACGTAMRLCASLFRGVAAPMGCVIFLLLSKLRLVRPALRAFPRVRDEGGYHDPRRAPRAAETPDGRLSKRLICRFLRLGSLH